MTPSASGLGSTHNSSEETKPQTPRTLGPYKVSSSCAFPTVRGRLRVFYISEIQSGGSKKYLDDLIRHYSIYGIEFRGLASKDAALKASDTFKENDILLFQYLMYTDFTFDDVLDLVH